MRKRWWKWFLGSVLLILAMFVVLDDLTFEYFMMKWSIKVPRTRDSRVVGQWQGTWKLFDDPTPRFRITIFRADGTGVWTDPSRGFHLPFDWGTERGVLYTRRMATDAWSGTNRLFSLSPDGKTIQFSKARTFDLVCKTMTRQSSGR